MRITCSLSTICNGPNGGDIIWVVNFGFSIDIYLYNSLVMSGI